ncbi:MAG TPA: HAD family hydrolase [Synergistales bacterium]|nr:HAD family hydrolase [Synergistales bacterium]
MIKAVMFDFDMTLVDSSHAITEGMNFIARKEGLRLLSHAEVLGIIGMPIEESWELVWGRYDESWLQHYRESFRETEYKGINLYSGTLPLLNDLRSMGIALGVASNRSKVTSVVRAVGLEEFFLCTLGLDDVERPKPAPDMLIMGMEILGSSPAETLYLGDTEADIAAAVAAGVRAVGVTTGNLDHESLLNAGAWLTLSDISGLKDIVMREMDNSLLQKDTLGVAEVS